MELSWTVFTFELFVEILKVINKARQSYQFSQTKVQYLSNSQQVIETETKNQQIDVKS